GLPSLRGERIFPALCRGLGHASRRGLRLLEFSVQGDHVHLIVEAADRRALSRGLQGLAIRLAKAVNRVLGRRGRVWGDRFHARALKTPREVRTRWSTCYRTGRSICRAYEGSTGDRPVPGSPVGQARFAG